jgi:hypothetical protein
VAFTKIVQYYYSYPQGPANCTFVKSHLQIGYDPVISKRAGIVKEHLEIPEKLVQQMYRIYWSKIVCLMG